MMEKKKSKFKKNKLSIKDLIVGFGVIILIVGLISWYQQKKTVSAPRVVSTSPANSEVHVDSNKEFISVTFDRPMNSGSYSWVQESKAASPKTTGKPFFDSEHKICKLPVSLEANTTYTILINSEKYRNFKDKQGNPAVPYRFTFSTGGVI